ncbi:MAG: polysaccharide deacetylase family protein [Clostridia bacterium]|nr:polysaccharide deacetylase family protein [Clostridia bacterium]
MKRWLIAVLALCLMLTCTAALAADKVTVYFTEKSGNVNGGFDYTLTVQTKNAVAADLPVSVKCNETGTVYAVTIPAGGNKASFTVETQVVQQREKLTFSFVDSDAYKNGSKHTLTVYQLPKVQFYLGVNFGTIGKEMTVMVQCNNPASVLKGNNTFELRDTDGTVLSTRQWSNAKNRLTFKFDVTEDMLGRHDFTVWLGDYVVSIDDGYGTVMDTSDKVVVELEPTQPLMGIGIDCGFNGRKTDDVLAVLEKHNVKCTFFMTGYFIREFTEDAQKILDAGHEIASHSNTHKHLKELKPYEQYRQIFIPVTEAEEKLGVTPRLFRPPHGEYNSQITSISRGEGMEVIMWSATFHDSTGKYSDDDIIRYATTGSDYKPGSIVLCHLDGQLQPTSLDTALTYYESLGLQAVPISALLYASGRELPEMPDAREPLVYTDEYWATWLENNLPEYAN